MKNLTQIQKLLPLIILVLLMSCNSEVTDHSEFNTRLTTNNPSPSTLTINSDEENETSENSESPGNENDVEGIYEPEEQQPLKYLALGDSYTIGTSVCETCRYPVLLQEKLREISETPVTLKIIAQSGWTTTALKSAIDRENLSNDYDLVTLLIGVNDQYQGRSFELYKKNFQIY